MLQLSQMLRFGLAWIAVGAVATDPTLVFAQPATAATTQEAEAKLVLLNFGKLVDAGKIDQAFRLYVSPAFVDHSDKARAMMHKTNIGYSDVIPFFRRMLKPGGPALVQEITADDNIVTVKGLLGQDIFRVSRGKMTDHWDTLGSEPGTLANTTP